MEWFKQDLNAHDSREVFDLSDELSLSQGDAFMLITCLRSWSVRNCSDGNVLALRPGTLALASRWKGDPQVLIAALKAANVVDSQGILSGWMDGVGGDIIKMNDKKERNRLSQQRSRERKRAAKQGTQPTDPMDNQSSASHRCVIDDIPMTSSPKRREEETREEDTTEVGGGGIFSYEDNPRARAYTREEPVTQERDAQPVTQKHDAQDQAIAAVIRYQVVRALDDVIHDTETSEKSADFLISNAETHDQLECVMKNFRREVKNGEATKKPVRRPLDYLVSMLNRAHVDGLRTKADFDRDAASFGSNYDDFDTG
ncbi:hypothetical protein FACS1894184_11600 [Clostridia bacterium]|nr:hypothetical protein FACS1894184_11600 [Clostridia bacterium]